MLGNNCEKTVITTTSPNKWTQQTDYQIIDIDDHCKVSMASSSSTGGSRVMEKPGQELLQQQQQALRCPRCDSSNTKFCYYNNYSLSQPRHFCKACKRYWTRGGTLRNVPVGGGCRKNKRVKRQSSSSNNNIDTSTSPSSSSNPPSQPHMDINLNPSTTTTTTTTSNHVNHNPLLYGLSNSCGHDVMNLSFPTRFVNSSRVSSASGGYDLLQPQLNALGLGCFSSGILAGEVNDDGYRNGLFSTSNNNGLLSSYNSIFSSTGNGNNSTSTNSVPSTPVMASLLSSTLLQQKFISSGGMKGDPFHGMNPLQNSSEAAEMVASKEVKGEGQNRLLGYWNNNSNNGGSACQNQMEHMGLMTDPSLYWNNNNNNNNNNTAAATALGGGGGGGAWSHDQPNIGPNSVTSLI